MLTVQDTFNVEMLTPFFAKRISFVEHRFETSFRFYWPM